MRLLLVEDEKSIANFIRQGLEEEGFAVDVASNGTMGLERALANDYDLLILDWMLPGRSGIDICRQLRKENRQVPIIFLTAKDTTIDTVFALESGANDYIKKPFEFDELLVRIRVQLRSRNSEPAALSAGDLVLDPDTHSVRRANQEIALTPKEFSLLEFLLRNKGKVCGRTRIIEHVWDIHFDSDTSVIDVYINYLRKKLDDGSGRQIIETVRGVGYRIPEQP
jgi:two-component system, OmpR family, copper resistance phosphate regulon response regulator CusR